MQPAMEKLSPATGETVNLAVPDGGQMLNVAEVPSTFILSCSGGWTGRRTTPHAVANGKVLLALRRCSRCRRRWSGTRAHTITTRAALHDGAGRGPPGRVRHRGRASWKRGWSRWPRRCSTPTGACVAALSISGPAFADAA